MTVIQKNARDRVLQAATIRTETVTLPPTVIVPPSQLGAGSLPNSVKGADGTTIVSTNGLRVATLYTDQIRDVSGNVMFQANGTMSLSKVAGVGSLASQNSVSASGGQVTGLGALAFRASVTAPELGVGTLAAGVFYAGSISADQITAGQLSASKISGGSFEGKTFIGGTFSGARLAGDVVNATNILASGYVEASRVIARSDVDAWDLAVNGTFRLNSRPAGSSGQHLILRGDRITGSITIDGQARDFSMTIGF